MSANSPTPDRPVMPDGYGVPETNESALPWSYVDEQMLAALNYWVATVRPDGRPHVMPVWGAWIDGKLYIEGSPDTVRHRNLTANPHVVVHLEEGFTAVVIIEGEAYPHGKPSPELGLLLSRQFPAKYESLGYAPGPDAWDNGGLYAITPRKAFAWTQFPQDVTRWQFE